ncbi:MAG TPA: glycosyltransferase family 2 protein [Anaerolineales bacterium]|nr:glycosyltransferase family 2 protein [Anaerolineales bacterium]
MNLTLGSPVLTVVIPVYNEGEILPSFAPSLIEFCHKKDWKIIFVNDGSCDESRQILDGLDPSSNLRVIHHKVNRGYGGALKTGISHVTTPFLVTLDGDGQHCLEDVERIFQFAIESDADMVVGKRDERGASGAYRTFGKFLIRSFTKILMPLPIADLNSGFKFYRTELVKRYMTVCPDSMAFSDVITLVFLSERNLVLEYPIQVLPRQAGQSMINTFTAFETVIQVLNIALMFNPLKLFLPISALCILTGFGWGIPFVLLGRGVSVGAMLAIVSGLLFFVLGLIASQLSAIRMERLRDLPRIDRRRHLDI